MTGYSEECQIMEEDLATFNLIFHMSVELECTTEIDDDFPKEVAYCGYTSEDHLRIRVFLPNLTRLYEDSANLHRNFPWWKYNQLEEE